MTANDDVGASSRRSVLKGAIGAVAGTGVLGSVVGTASAASRPRQIGGAPVDRVAGERYATMGTDPSAPTASLYGNFKCPYTRDFVLNHLPALVRDYVRPGTLSLRFRSLAYEPNPDDPSHGISPEYISEDDPDIARAALGTWNEEPGHYWEFFLDTFENQPSGGYSVGDLEAMLKRYGVDHWERIGDYVANDRYEDALRDTQDAAAGHGVTATPTLVVEGDATYPHHGGNNADLYDWLDARL